MAKKHLHELLTEEQEPFVLKDYINEKRCQIKRPVPETQLQLKRRKPISESPTFSGNFRKNVKKSPLFTFPSPAKSPIRSPNTLFIKPPSKTTALLLEAALRIQKQKQPKNSKSIGFGFFGSILKKIALRKRTRKREICAQEIKVSVKDILRWESLDGCQKSSEKKYEKPQEMTVDLNEKEISEMGFSCSCNTSSWSGSYEDKSMDLETWSSTSDDDFEEFAAGRLKEDFCSCKKGFCSSPFRFVCPVKSPYLGGRTPEFASPASSPDCRKAESIEDSELNSCRSRSRDDECLGSSSKEEEKEQFSPVSTLDPPFEDDDETHDEDVDDEHNFQHSSTLQRAKHLLNKLRRFERLAKLDPLELDKIYDQEEESDEDDAEEEEIELLSLEDEEVEEFVRDALHQSTSCCYLGRIPGDMRRLVLDLIEEEKEEALGDEEVVEKVCRKIKSWKKVESNTVDMTVEIDFRREGDAWKRCRKEDQEIGIKIELAIFALLVEEVWVGLV